MSSEQIPIPVVVLAAGESTRLPGKTPKPFRDVQFAGQTAQMWEQSIAALRMSARVHLAMREDDAKWFRATERRTMTELMLMQPTSGQAHTLLRALDVMRNRTLTWQDHDIPDVLVVNCDQGFSGDRLDQLVRLGRMADYPVAVTTHATEDERERWSFVDQGTVPRMDGLPTFVRAAEKRYLDVPRALAGAYYFPLRSHLFAAVRCAVDRTYGTGWEPYISHAFEFYTGHKIAMDIPRHEWFDWGTARALEAYEIAHGRTL